MKLSTKGKYGLYAMYYLAEQKGNGPQSLKAVAGIGIPEDYLEQLLASLRKAGLVTTVRGAQGGYALSREPGEITVGDIINATEGPVSIAGCVDDESCCEKSGGCPSRRVWFYLADRFNSLLQSITLQDMMEQEKFDVDSGASKE